MQTAKVIRGDKWSATNNGHTAALPLPQTLQRPWWSRVLHWEDLVVAGREVKGIVLTPTMALTLLLAFMSALGAVYWRTSGTIQEQRDLLIRLDEKLSNRTENDKEFRQEMKNDLDRKFQNQDAMWKVNEKRMAKLEEK